MKAVFLSLLIVLGFSTNSHAQDVGEALSYLPVQDGGRLKPFDTFAKETLQLVYGKKKYQGRSAVNVVMTWMLIPDHWDKLDFVEVRHSGLRDALKLDNQKILFSPNELMQNSRIALLFQELRSLREKREKLDPFQQAVSRLESQLTMYQAIKNGLALRVLPPSAEGESGWLPIAQLPPDFAELFKRISSQFVQAVAATASNDKEKSKEANAAFESEVERFMAFARSSAKEKYADMTKIKMEVHYNSFHPVMWAWIMYLVGALMFLIFMVSGRSYAEKLGWFGFIIGFCLHTYGIGLRVYLAGRPPVSNMYETVVWVSWGAMLFAFILERLQKSKIILVCAAAVAILCLILTDLAPTVLDPSLSPLEPVLRSTFWLTTHVLIITISYAAFFLAFAIADLALFYFLRDENRFAKEIQKSVNSIYRAIQIGVVLLAAGVILGGIWADYSWGRFWGWDPKETWALIALLGYIALLHGRLAGWVKNFGMVTGSILAFSLVLMAWYGVNFVLGAGLHSYGFGAGGVEYVSAFVALHLFYVVYASAMRYSRRKDKQIQAAK